MKCFKLTPFLVFFYLMSFPALSEAQVTDSGLTSLTVQTTGAKSLIEAKTPIKKALPILETKYGVSFLYESSLLNDKITSGAVNLVEKEFEHAIQDLLKGTNLTYTRVGTQTFAIVWQNEGNKPKETVHVVEGIVTDATDGEVMPGVNIIVKGTAIGTSTDSEGSYSLNAPAPEDTLLFSFIGYKILEVPIQGRNMINVAMSRTSIIGEELVVVGYGNQKKQDVTGSISSVTSEEMRNVVSGSFEQALLGRTSGVMVMKNSGQPGASVSVQIRGVNTLSSASEPLYIIDGIPVSAESDGISNPLATLNMDDIESIDILKDASSAAIYGSRASNGVVLITTKRGRAGDVNIDYNGYFGAQQLPNKLDVMNLQEYAEYRNRKAEVVGWGTQPEFADPSLLGKGTDWQDVLYREALMSNHNFSVSGGNEQTQFMLSLGYFDQEGIAVESDFERYSVRLNLDNKATEWFKIGTSFNLSRTNENVNVSQDDIVNLAIRQNPDIPVKHPDGSWGGPSQSEFTLANPVALAHLNTNQRMRSQALGNIYARITILEKLEMVNELNGTFSYTNDYVFNPTYEFNARVNDVNTASRSASNNTFWQARNYLNYRDTFNKLNLTVMGGHEVHVSEYEGLSGSRERFPSNNVQELNAGDAQTAQNGSYAGSSSMQSVFTRINLDYDGRYLLTSNYRLDASSNFAEENRWSAFPSVSLGWRASNESFLEDVNLISELKLRAGFGVIGNQNIGGYLYEDTYITVPTQWGTGVRPGNLGNPELQWESTASYNLGLDLSLLEQRINLTVDTYLKRTKNLLLQLPLPLYSGTSGTGSFNSPVDNIGSMDNRGLEVTLNTINKQGRFRWESDLTVSFNRNEVAKLNSESSIIDRQINFFDTITRTAVGEPVGQFYGYVVEGIFEDEDDIRTHAVQNDNVDPNSGVWVGDIKFKDLNGDGIIDDQDRAFIGNPMPDFQYGITNWFYFRNFDLSIFLNGSYGNDIFNQVRRTNEDPSSDFGMLGTVANHAQIGLRDPEGSSTDISNVYVTNPDTDVPRITSSDPNNNQRISDRFVEDGSYLRIQNVTLGYTLSVDLITRFNLKNLRVYGTVENLFTFTGYSGYDPEIGTQTSDPLMVGIDNGRYPSQRVITFGISIGL